MNWILASALMFISSVCLYLAVRKASLRNIPRQLSNLTMFAIPLPLYIFLAIHGKQNFLLSISQVLIIAAAAVFFSYLGNVFSLMSIQKAPNPGYSLVLSKSYVVFTTLIAVVFLHEPLSLQKALSIAAIVGFSTLIGIDPKATKKQNETTLDKTWLPFAFGAFFCWAFLTLTGRSVFAQGVGTSVFLTYINLIVTGCILAEIRYRKIALDGVQRHWKLLLLIGAGSASFNYFLFEAIKSAPNVGYVNAINASSISAVTIMAVILFKDELSARKMVGIFGVIAGLIGLIM